MGYGIINKRSLHENVVIAGGKFLKRNIKAAGCKKQVKIALFTENKLTFAPEKETEGTEAFPSSFFRNMNKEEIIEQIQEKVVALLTQNPSHFLVDIRIKPTNNFKIFIDGDKGVGIDDLVKYNRALYKQIEEEGLFPDGDFSLEVSSPGLDEPLKLHRQYVKNVGREVEVITLDGKKVEGKLLSLDDEGLVVEETTGKGRKMETTTHSILFEAIKTTKIQIKF